MYFDRVRDTTQTTGTGNITMDGAPPTGFQSFADANPTAYDVFYCIVDSASGEWEVGYGNMDPGTGIMQRNTGAYTVVASSDAADAAIAFTAGSKDVLCVQPAGVIGEGRVVAVAGAPTAADDESKGFVVDKSIWIDLTGKVFYQYNGAGVWATIALSAFVTRVEGSGTAVSPASSMHVDTTGLNRVATGSIFRTLLSGRFGRAHVSYSHVHGHGVYGSETGYGFHQTEIYGTAAETTDASTLNIIGVKIQEDGTGIYELHVVAHENAGDYKVWKSTVVLSRIGTAAATIAAGGTPTMVAESAGATTWTLVLSSPFSGASAGLQTAITGEAGKTIHWTIAVVATFAHNSAYT